MNIVKMMKQAAELQKKMESVQKSLAEQRVEHTSGGGAVRAVARGDLTIERIRIDPKVVDPSDVELLEDLVTSAVNGALQDARDRVAREMAKLTEGLPLPPGLSLPWV